MSTFTEDVTAASNVARYPWFKFFHGLVFWQAIWFLYFQSELSAAEAILLYVIYDVGTTVLEVPSGYMSDRLGRRFTLIASGIAGCAGALLLAFGGSFEVFALAQVLLGASAAFASGTDSALLFESLVVAGREAEIEEQELKAWRFSFSALAVSSILGGVMAVYMDTLPFFAGALAFAGLLIITLGFTEPPRASDPGTDTMRLGSLRAAFTTPVLIWLFVLSVLMYVFSHIPFVFGQPFILEALKDTGLDSDAPIVSGVVSAVMMVISVITSLFALKLRHRFGLPAIVLFAFAMQIGLSGVLALTNDWIAIAFLFLRMVPDSLSRPFILGRIQPLLNSESRATYMSLQSFCGRLIFAGALFLASLSTSDTGQMPYAEIQQVLGWFVVVGIVCFVALAVAVVRVRVDTAD